MTSRRRPLDLDQAETLALGALRFLAGDMARLSRFLAITGIGPADLRSGAGDHAVLTAVLDFLLQDQSLLLVYAAENSLEPATVEDARRVLGGRPDLD
ncbi:MAG: DUF3572 domain-containing protein [Hyphomicrobiaceae bacterium]|nr:DUF3572 domain-containing protein [Hyphomicrobiaceae bacterium]